MPPTLKKKKYTKNLCTLKRQVSLINKMRTNFPTWASRATLQTKKYKISTPKRKSVLLCYPFPSPTYTHIVTLSQIQTHTFSSFPNWTPNHLPRIWISQGFVFSSRFLLSSSTLPGMRNQTQTLSPNSLTSFGSLSFQASSNSTHFQVSTVNA
jgi:hypothetical protein